MRLAFIQVVAGHFHHAGLVEKPLIDDTQRPGVGVEPLLDIEQKDLIQLGHGLGGPVITPHQRFTGASWQLAAIFSLAE